LLAAVSNRSDSAHGRATFGDETVKQAEDRKSRDAETPATGGLQLEVFDVLPEIVLPDEESQMARLVVEMAGKKLVVFVPRRPKNLGRR
jgi:hypothetical protein